MKKTSLLCVFALAVFASQAWAQWTACTGTYAGYCYWPNTEECGAISTGPAAEGGKATCAEAYNNCKSYGFIYTDEECETWSGDGNDPNFVIMYCKWPTGCENLLSEDDIDNCKENGSLFSDSQCKDWTGEGRDPDDEALGCCAWAEEENGACWTIYSSEEKASTKVSDCQKGSNRFWANIACPADGACPTTTPTYPKSSSSTASSSSTTTVSSSSTTTTSSSSTTTTASSSSTTTTGSSSSATTTGSSSSATTTGSSSSTTATGSSSSATAGSSSSSSGAGGYNCKLTTGYCVTTQTISECTNVYGGEPVDNCNSTPIINISSINGLTVVSHARTLRISSANQSRVQLYDMRGELVFSRMVPAGHITVNLENEKRGVYYAVVNSGSYKKTIKIVVM